MKTHCSTQQVCIPARNDQDRVRLDSLSYASKTHDLATSHIPLYSHSERHDTTHNIALAKFESKRAKLASMMHETALLLPESEERLKMEQFAAQLDGALPDDLVAASVAELQLMTSQIGFLCLWTRVLNLMMKSNEQRIVLRHQNRLLQGEHTLQVVKSYKQTAEFSYKAELFGGIAGMVSAALPIVGYTSAGELLKKMISNGFNTAQDLDAITAFKQWGEMIGFLSPMQRNIGEVRKYNAEGDRYGDTQFVQILGSDCDEDTRILEDTKQSFRAWVQSLEEMWKQIHELVISLLNMI